MSDGRPWPVWVDGALGEPGAPAIAAEDPGFLLGVAVFDTLLCEDGRLFFVEEHLERLRLGARTIEVELADEALLRRGLGEVARALDGRAAAVRITLTPGAPGRGPSMVITTREWVPPPPEGVSVLLVERAKVPGQEIEALKSTSRVRNVLARRRAQARGAYEALLGTDDGDYAEGTVSNLFLARDGELQTPPLERGCLAGILREKLIDLARGLGIPLREAPVVREDLAAADEVFLTNSLGRLIPVHTVLDLREDLPRGGGPLCRALRGALEGLERERRAADGTNPGFQG